MSDDLFPSVSVGMLDFILRRVRDEGWGDNATIERIRMMIARMPALEKRTMNMGDIAVIDAIDAFVSEF